MQNLTLSDEYPFMLVKCQGATATAMNVGLRPDTLT